MKQPYIEGGVALIGLSLISAPAEAALLFTMQQVGPDVVITTTGTLVNPVSLTPPSFPNIPSLPTGTSLIPATGLLQVGATGSPTGGAAYTNAIVSGPISFGSGFTAPAPTSATGDSFGIGAGSTPNAVFLDLDFLFGAPFTLPTATWAGQTLASLGVTPGTYVWTLDSRFSGDTITLQVNAPEPPPSVPEPGTILGLLAVGALGAASRKRKR